MFRITATLLALSLSFSAFAQTSEADLRARLIKKPIFLRGLWRDNKLSFDESGHLIGNSPTVDFTLACVQIDSVKLTSNSLVLKGLRVGLVFDKGAIESALLSEKVSIEIKTPSSGDFTTALNAIWTNQYADLVPSLPDYWRPYVLKKLISSNSSNADVTDGDDDLPDMTKGA